MRNRLFIGVVLLALLGVSGVRVSLYLNRHQLIREQQRVQIPAPEKQSSSVAPSSTASSFRTSEPALREAVNWDVPFTPQAPLANWDAVHEEACEEASVLMVLKYFHGEPMGTPDDAEKALQDILARNDALGFPVDDTAAQIVILLANVDPSLKASLLKDPTVDQLRTVLSGGSLVIVPAAGRQLGNPYYTAPGPLYHMLVIRGYTKDGYAITNDPGTKRGAQYVYRWATLLGATHDWNGGDVESGARVVVVVSR